MSRVRTADEQEMRRRDPLRRGVVAVGRDGRQISRTRRSGADEFAFDPSIIPDGWEYQWNTVTIHGNAEVVRDQSLQMANNHWTPVPAERHDGVFMPRGHKGEIVIRGSRLEERPTILCEEARLEDRANANQQMVDRNQSLKLSNVNKNLPQGFDPLSNSQRRVLRTGGDNIRLSLDTSLDTEIPRPSHTLAEPSEE